MNHLKFLIVILCVQGLSSAWAAEPSAPQSTEAAPTATSPAAAPESPASSTAPTTSSSAAPAKPAPTEAEVEAAKKALDAQAKRLRSLGYRPEVQNGRTVFCKKEAMIGTTFPTKTCGNGDAIEEAAKLNHENLYTTPKAPGFN
jgi:hypothetical protein